MFYIIGCGRQGSAIGRYLMENTEEEIVSYDVARDAKDVMSFADSNTGQWRHVKAKFSQFEFRENPTAESVIIDCLPAYMSPRVARYAVDANCHYLNLGGSEELAQQIRYDLGLRLQVKSYEDPSLYLAAILDCGVAPGLASCLAKKHIRPTANEDWVKLRILCGGLPLHPHPAALSGYAVSFGIQGVVREYTGTVEHLVCGDYVGGCMPREMRYPVHVPGFGLLEGSETSGGLALLVRDLAWKEAYRDSSLMYLTLRYPGHWDAVDSLINDAYTDVEGDILKPQKVGDLCPLLRALEQCPKVGDLCPDVLILGYERETDNGKSQEFWRFDFDHERQFSAMEQATGFSAGYVAAELHDQRRYIRSGVHGMDYFEFDDVMKQLQKTCKLTKIRGR